MATSGVRLTLKFNFQQGLKILGWSESYDLLFATLASAQANIDTITKFVTLRLYCLGTGPVCVSAVLTADPGGIIVPPRKRRATLSIQVPDQINVDTVDAVYNKALGLYNADYGTTVLSFDLQTDPNAVPTYRRNLWLAGIPDACDQTGTTLPVAGVWITAFNKFQAAMLGIGSKSPGALGILAIRSNDASDGNPTKLATAYNLVSFNFTVPAHGFVNGQLIEAIGFRGLPGQTSPKGNYKAIVVDANTIALAGAKQVTVVVPPGGFRAVKYVWNAVVTTTMKGFSKRDKGSPFMREVGRHKRPAISRA